MEKIDSFSKILPVDEKYDLYTQIRRSSKGLTGNIPEGYGRYHYLDSLPYYSIARSELNETLANLINARVLEYITQPDFESLYQLIRHNEKTLNGFISPVRRQWVGAQEYGDKRIHETSAGSDVTLFKEESE